MLLPSIFGESLLDEFFDHPHQRNHYQSHVSEMMRTDIKDLGNAYEMTMNLPGIKKENVKAELKDGYLKISASSASQNEEKNSDGVYIRRERYAGTCSRSFYVGEDVKQEDIKKSFIKVGIGTEKKSRIISDKEKKITAYHEAGHAILFHVLPDVGPVYTVSIIPTGLGAAGYTMPLPEKDEMFMTKGKMLQEIMVSLGGRIAEEIIFDDITTGASSDIKKATKVARRMVTRYGMSDNIGVINYDDDDDEVFIGRDLAHAKSHSELVSGEIDREVKEIIDGCYAKAKAIITDREDVLHKCAELLLEKEKITREEFEALMEDKPYEPEDFFKKS